MVNLNRIASLGQIVQLAYVPADVEGALAYWTRTIGAGPFFHNPHIAFDALNYRGRPSPVDMSSWLGYWGDMQIEIIRQHNDAPSIYKDWRDRGLEGVQHVAIMADPPIRPRLAEVGAAIVQDGRVMDQEFFYADLGGGPGSMVEIMPNSPLAQHVFGTMRAAAQDWDGREPIRDLSSLMGGEQ